MFGTILSSLFLTSAGKFYDKYGVRLTAILATTGLGISLIYMANSDVLSQHIFSSGIVVPSSYISFFIIFLGFFFIRFFGQGVLTMVSRNMIMKWFVRIRGFANGISSVFVALGFSIMPLVFDQLIRKFTWDGTWMFLAIITGGFFTCIVLFFFRDNPEYCGLSSDGSFKIKLPKTNISPKAEKQYTLAEAKKTYSFWIFALSLSLYALYNTGLTFHVVSVFKQAGMNRFEAMSVFIPMSVIAVVISLFSNTISDYIRLKYLLLIMLTGSLISTYGLMVLTPGLPKIMIITGNGILNGIFNVLLSVTWPRYYGTKHLGAISGLNMSLVVFGSALGPWMFSQLFQISGSYAHAGLVCFLVSIVLFIGTFKADNPQDR